MKVVIASWDASKTATVEAWPTCSKYFVVTRHVWGWNGKRVSLWRGVYQVTHVGSGAQAFPCGIKGRRKAQLYAAILSGFPIDWSKVTRQNCHRFLSDEAAKYRCMRPWRDAVIRGESGLEV